MKVKIQNLGNIFPDGTKVVELFADIDDTSELTNDDLNECININQISGGSTIFTKGLKHIGTFSDDHLGVDSIDWGEE